MYKGKNKYMTNFKTDETMKVEDQEIEKKLRSTNIWEKHVS